VVRVSGVKTRDYALGSSEGPDDGVDTRGGVALAKDEALRVQGMSNRTSIKLTMYTDSALFAQVFWRKWKPWPMLAW
jgi:hypothetical protein